ncbi:MAG TPA: nitroreductase family protein [Dehalococcoidales bacterium]|nr:nitroreductase family protein [Dehalococcoidales bacterium]
MDSLMEVIKKRRSVRAYQDKPLPKKIIKDILEAARYAPTARNAQELEYRVVTNKTMMDKMSAAIGEGANAVGYRPGGAVITTKFSAFHHAPLVIIIIAPKDNNWATADAAIAIDHVMLYATSIGLGSCFIGMARLMAHDKALMDELHIFEDRAIVGTVVCGYPNGWPEEKEKIQKAEFFE